MKALNIQIEDRQHEWLREKAFRERTSMSDIVREIITKNMEGESKMPATYRVTIKRSRLDDPIAEGIGTDPWRVANSIYSKCAGGRMAAKLTEKISGDEPNEGCYRVQFGFSIGKGGGDSLDPAVLVYIEKSESMTTAERIAKALGNDGECWESEDGRDLDALADKAGADVTLDRERELKRYLFPDGSAIVAGVGAWDIEGDEPFSWAGAE